MKTKYKVLNYHSFIVLPTETKGKEVFIEAGNLPKLEPEYKTFTLDEIRFINDKTQYFKIGRLEFEEADKNELFKHLEIEESEKTFFAKDILDIVKNPTKEKLDRVLAIDNIAVIDLFKGLVTSYKNTEVVDISHRVVKLVNKRWEEVYSNPFKPTTIVVGKTENEKEAEAREKAIAKAMAKREEELEKEYEAKLKAEIAKLKKASTASKKTVSKASEDSNE